MQVALIVWKIERGALHSGGSGDPEIHVHVLHQIGILIEYNVVFPGVSQYLHGVLVVHRSSSGGEQVYGTGLCSACVHAWKIIIK